MTTDALTDVPVIVDKTISQLNEITTLPEVTVRIIELVEDPRSTARDLRDVIKSDPALSARILKVVNSAFYGLPGKVANLDRAVALLGLSAVKNIAIAASIARIFRAGQMSRKFSARDLWTHSLAVGVASRMICLAVQPKIGGEELFLAGLIHDLGILVERQAFPDQLREAIERCGGGGLAPQGDFCDAETAAIGADHQAFGQALTAKWRFPPVLQNTVGKHHAVDRIPAEHQQVGSIVRLADVFCCRERIGFHLTAAGEQIDSAYLDAAGISARVLVDVRANLPEQLASAEAVLTA